MVLFPWFGSPGRRGTIGRERARRKLPKFMAGARDYHRRHHALSRLDSFFVVVRSDRANMHKPTKQGRNKGREVLIRAAEGIFFWQWHIIPATDLIRSQPVFNMRTCVGRHLKWYSSWDLTWDLACFKLPNESNLFYQSCSITHFNWNVMYKKNTHKNGQGISVPNNITVP